MSIPTCLLLLLHWRICLSDRRFNNKALFVKLSKHVKEKIADFMKYYVTETNLGSAGKSQKVPKSVRHFGHSIPALRAMSARNLVCRCPLLGPWMPTWRAQVDHLMVSDRTPYVHLFLILLVSFFLIPSLYCHSLHTGIVDAKVFIKLEE